MGLLLVAALVLVGLASHRARAFSGGLNLGQAGPQNFAVLSLGSPTDVSITGPSSEGGGVANVGVPAGGGFSMSDGSVGGAVYLNTAAKANVSGPSVISGGIVQNAATDAQLAQAVQDAKAASAFWGAQPATISSPTSINLGGGSMTINGGPGTNVLNLSMLVLNGSATVTLNAPAGSLFIINVTGKFALSGTSHVFATGGISQFCVLYNILGAGEQVAFSGGLGSGNIPRTSIDGILLAPQRDIALSPGLVNGEIIGGGKQINITSGGEIRDNSVCPAPAISCPTNVTRPADSGKCSAVVTFTVTASSTCSAVTVTSTPPSGTAFPVGTTTVTSTATDSSGQSSTCSFTVTVVDTQPPAITCPSNISVNTAPGTCSAVATYNPTATDNCAGVKVSASPPSGSTFPVGTNTVMVTATDASGNTATCSFKVTVTDNEKPQITCPSNITKGTDAGKCSAVVTYSATATDNCAGVGTVSFTPPSGTAFAVGTTHVTATVSDAAGNTATCGFDVTVNDTEKPQLACPSNITKNSDVNSCGAVVTYTATVKDNCDGTTDQVTFSPPSGTMFPVGTTTVMATAHDKAGNTASCSFTVTVLPPAPPCDQESPLLQGRVFFSTTFTPNQPGFVQGPTMNVGLDAGASQFGGLANAAFISPTVAPFKVYEYHGYIPGFSEVGSFDSVRKVYLIMFSPLVSGNIWVVNPNSPNANPNTTASFRNMVNVRDGLFTPPATPSGGTLNGTYVIRMLFSHPFLPTCGAAGGYTITGLDFSGSEGNLYNNTYPSPGSPSAQRLNSAQWSAQAGPPPPSPNVIPPGWMAQTIVQFQQDAGKSFHLFVDGTYGDTCGNNLKTFSIHPEGDPSPGDQAGAFAAGGTGALPFEPSPE
jgi:choice-of-anchor A domain-containing protein